MATKYDAEQLAAMASEFDRVAVQLGIDLPAEPSELTEHILTASARWSRNADCRALGPFGAFLVGAADEPDLELIDRLVAAQPRQD